jgi:hypothetical protein
MSSDLGDERQTAQRENPGILSNAGVVMTFRFRGPLELSGVVED